LNGRAIRSDAICGRFPFVVDPRGVIGVLMSASHGPVAAADVPAPSTGGVERGAAMSTVVRAGKPRVP